MAKNPYVFPVTSVGDWIIIERLNIKNRYEIQAEKSNILLSDMTVSPKNIMDIEKNKAAKIATYEDAEGKMLKEWEEHPNQGIVMSVGKGRPLEEGVFIPIEVKKGDHVYMRDNVGDPVIVNKKLYWAIKEYDIFAIAIK